MLQDRAHAHAEAPLGAAHVRSAMAMHTYKSATALPHCCPCLQLLEAFTGVHVSWMHLPAPEGATVVLQDVSFTCHDPNGDEEPDVLPCVSVNATDLDSALSYMHSYAQLAMQVRGRAGVQRRGKGGREGRGWMPSCLPVFRADACGDMRTASPYSHHGTCKAGDCTCAGRAAPSPKPDISIRRSASFA